jgi:hypothetical protein
MTSFVVVSPYLLRIEGTDSQSQIFRPSPHTQQPRVFLRGGALWFPLSLLLTKHGRLFDSLGLSRQTSRRLVREYSSFENWAFGHLPDRAGQIRRGLRLGTALDVTMAVFIASTYTKKPLCAWL